MSLLSGGGSSSAVISGVTVTGSAVAGQTPIATSSSAGAWTFPPGFELGYTEITASVNIVSTTEATGTTIITANAITFDGTAVVCEVFSSMLLSGTGHTVRVNLFEGATQIGRLGQVAPGAGQIGTPMFGRLKFTPTAAAHTYTVTAFVLTDTTGTPTVTAGAGGAATSLAAYVRFVKA